VFAGGVLDTWSPHAEIGPYTAGLAVPVTAARWLRDAEGSVRPGRRAAPLRHPFFTTTLKGREHWATGASGLISFTFFGVTYVGTNLIVYPPLPLASHAFHWGRGPVTDFV